MDESANLRNLHYAEDVRYAVRIHRFVLGTIGVWPLGKSRHCGRFFKRLLNAACCFLLSVVLIPWSLHLFLIIHTFEARLKMSAAFCFYIMVPVVYCVLIFREDRMRKCVKHVQEDWRNVRNSNDRKIMLRKAKTGRVILVWATFFLFTSAFTYRLIQPIARGTMVVKGNVTIRPLVQGNYFIFFDPQQSPAYEMVFSVQCVAAVVVYIVMSSVCGLTALFTMHACGQLEILVNWLENFSMEDGWSTANQARRLATIIRHHVRIHRFLREIEGVIGETCFVEIIGCTLILCLLGYNAIVGWEESDSITTFTYAVVLLSFTFNIFILCYIGEILSIQGHKVNVTCCTINWYRLPSKQARYLILVIAMANCPTKLTANKLIELSLSSFGAVIRTAMAYLNLLRTIAL